MSTMQSEGRRVKSGKGTTGERRDVAWVDSMTLEAWQRAGRAFLALDDLRVQIRHGSGPRDEILFRRIARELSEIRDLLGTCRRNHVRPLVEAETDEKPPAEARQ